MKTGIVAPERGMPVDRNNGGYNLGSQENKNWQIKRGFCEKQFARESRLNQECAQNNGSKSVGEHDFVVLKKFKVKGGEKKGNEKKQQDETRFYYEITNVSNISLYHKSNNTISGVCLDE